MLIGLRHLQFDASCKRLCGFIGRTALTDFIRDDSPRKCLGGTAHLLLLVRGYGLNVGLSLQFIIK